MSRSESDSTSSDEEDDYYSKFSSHGGVKSILLYQFEPQFTIVIITSICISYLTVLVQAAFVLGTKEENLPHIYSLDIFRLLYAFDIIYFFDLISMTIFRSVDWLDVKYRYQPRNALVLFVEYLTLIPTDGIYYTLTNPLIQIMYLLRLRYALRVIRLIAYYKRSKTYIGASGYVFQLIFVLFVISFLVITMASLGYVLVCRRREGFCEFENYWLLETIIYTCFTKITIMGGTSSFKEELLFPGVWIILYLAYLCNVFLISNFTCDIIQLMTKQYMLVHNYQRIEKTLFEWLENITKSKSFFKRFKAVVQEIYDLFWSRKAGVNSIRNLRKYMPEVMFHELSLDMSWSPLKHTHVFRNEDIHYLRYISTLMTHTFLTPGDVIYKKNEYKSKMVYIISGVVDILSEEDNETCIISFADGTCLGESTLVIDYRSTATVICKKFCEVTILERKHFITASKLYPARMASALSIIRNQYNHSKHFVQLKNIQINNTNMKSGEMTIRWLKYILRKLLQFKVNMNGKYLKAKLDNFLFYTNYLDVLAIAQELELVTDSIFLQKKFPFIFQPTSIFITAWNRLIFVVFSIFSIVFIVNVSIFDEITMGYVIFHIIVTILWTVDVYIHASTAVRTSNFYYTNLTDILVYRTMSPAFLLDIFAATSPSVILLLMNHNVSLRFMILIESNKLLKWYKINSFIEAWESKSTNKLIIKKYIKCVYYLLIISVYVAGILHLSICQDGKCPNVYTDYLRKHNATEPFTVFLFEIYLVCKFLCNFERSAYVNKINYKLMFAIHIVLYVYNLYFITSMSAGETLKMLDMHNLNAYTYSLKIAMETTDLTDDMQQYIWSHVRTLSEYTGSNFLHGETIYENLPKYLIDMSRHIKYGNFVKQIPIFHKSDNDIVTFAASLMKQRIYPKYAVITSDGDICREMHIIIRGYCKVTFNNEVKIMSPGESFNVFELCMQVNAMRSITSETHCLIMSMNLEDYMKILIRYPEFNEHMKYAIKNVEKDAMALCKYENCLTLSSKVKKSPSYMCFVKRNVDKTTYKQYSDAFSVCNRIFKYVLLPVTFSPHNTWIIAWEIIRCVAAIMYWFILPTDLFDPCHICTPDIIIMVLDFTAVVNVYIRHHIWYYNEKGIEVKHPLYTAKHYWKHALFIDMFQVFPFTTIASLTGANTMFLLFKLNRLLQIRHVFGLMAYVWSHKMKITMWEYLKFLPGIIMILNILAGIEFNVICKYENSTTISCSKDSWVYTQNLSSTVTNLVIVEYYIYSLFLMTTYFTNTYYSLSDTNLLSSRLIMTIIAYFGYVFWAIITAKIVAICMSKNDDLFKYQDSLRELLKFMNYRRIDKRLKREIINHFNNMWQKKRGKNIIDLLHYFSYGVQKDILFQTFGIRMCASRVFSVGGLAVIRSLLLYASHEIILNHGIIYRVNDVLDKIFYLYNGKVEVLGPDLKHIDFLYDGSLFGNLDNYPISRQTITVVASGHVDLLVFSSVQFHQILSNYPDVMNYFRRQTCINVDYLEDKISRDLKTEMKKTKKSKDKQHTITYNNGVKAWRSLITALSYVSFMIELYHIVTLEHARSLIALLYIIDIAHWLKLFLRLHTAYEDEYGLMEKNKQKISTKYHSEIFGFYFDLCSIIPFEVICVFFIPYPKLMLLVWTYSRCNRLIRIAFVIKNVSNLTQKFNSVVYILRMVYIFVWLSVVHFVLACGLFFIDSFTLDIDKMSSIEKFLTFEQDVNLIMSMMMKITINYDRKLLNAYSTAFMTFSAILSRFLSMSLLAELVTTLQIANRGKYNFQKFAIQLSTYMQNENVSYPLRKKISRYISSLWLYNKGMQFPRLINKAPYYLREAMLNSLFGVHLRKHPIFSNCHVDLIRQIASNLKTRYFYPGDIIIFIGDIDHCMYFIQEGEVEALSEDSMYSEVVDEVLHSGDMFGFEQGIRPRLGHDYTYKATKNTVVLVLKREDWIYLLDFFPASKISIYGFDKIEK